MNAENKICAEARPIIQVNNLTKSFGKLEVLKGISETIYEGEVVSIIGPSGGGKSTFLRCLNLLEQPTSGQILFDGTDICTIKGKTIDEALKLTNKAVVEALDGLPPVKLHCSVLAEQAVKAALADYYRRQGVDPEPIVGKLEEDCHACACEA